MKKKEKKQTKAEAKSQISKDYSVLSNGLYVFRRMLQYDKKYPVYIATHGISAFLGPLIAAFIPSVAVSLVMSKTTTAEFTLYMLGLVSVYLLLGIVATFFDHKIQEKNFYMAYQPVQRDTVEKILYTDYANLENAEVQQVADSSKYSYSVEWQGWRRTMEMYSVAFFNIIGIIVYGILLIGVCPQILIVFVAMAGLNVYLEQFALDYSRKMWGTVGETNHRINYFFQKSTSAVDGKDIRMYRMEYWFGRVIQGLVKKRMKVWKKIEMAYFTPFLSDTIFSMIRDIMAYTILVQQFIAGRMDAATFTLYLGIINGFARWLTGGGVGDGLTRALSEIFRCNWGISEYRSFLNVKEREGNDNSKGTEDADKKYTTVETNKVVDCSGSGHSDNSFTKGKKNEESVEGLGVTIEFRDVCFGYPESDKDVIHHMTGTIHSGEKIALVGVNGAGKTTLVKLLCGFYTPDSGEIFVDGVSIKDYPKEMYLQKVEAVFQDMMVLAASVAENVACTKRAELDMARVKECLDLAGLKEKVNTLAKKEDTSVTNFLDKDGVLFSGGETQKLILARALYKDAPLLLLDEPTSALDPLAESALYEKYNELSKNKTTIFISHRLASTRFCDKILFFSDGQVKEQGTHDELMAAGGAYAEMFAIQSQYYEKKNEGGEDDE